MTLEQALAERDRLEQAMSEATLSLKKFPRLANGLTPDEVKFTPEYKAASAISSKAFADLRKFNGFFVKNFKGYRRIRQSVI